MEEALKLIGDIDEDSKLYALLDFLIDEEDLTPEIVQETIETHDLYNTEFDILGETYYVYSDSEIEEYCENYAKDMVDMYQSEYDRVLDSFIGRYINWDLLESDIRHDAIENFEEIINAKYLGFIHGYNIYKN